MKRRKPNVGIVTFPNNDEAGLVALKNLVDVVFPTVNNVYVITGGPGYNHLKRDVEVQIYKVDHISGSNNFTKVIRYAFTQIKISQKILKISPKIHYFIFFVGGPSLLLPMLVCKLIRKKVVLNLAGSDIDSIKAKSTILAIPIKIMVKLDFALSDCIVIYAESIIDQYLIRYRSKIRVAHKHFLDFQIMRIIKPLNERGAFIGYIGRLSEEKGIINFINAIPIIIQQNDSVQLFIGGDGNLLEKVEEYLNRYNLRNKVQLVSWISHDEIPLYLNKLKLIVLPSYTEGLPNVMLEAMACGTPVLVTPVGAIPNFIIDSETGFVMENNSPFCIALNISRALNHPQLEQIAQKARSLVENEFTFEKAVEGYRRILNEL
jgi:glycosyltransferase involved in cell wall biosynthesis